MTKDVRSRARDLARTALRSAVGAVPVLPEIRIASASQPLSSRWSDLPVEPHGDTMLGVSFRPLQAAALGLDPGRALTELLVYPFPVLRLAAYWNELEPSAGHLAASGLDEQIGAATTAGKKVILCVGAVKAFGYPEFFVPAHHLPEPLPEGRLISPETHPGLADAAAAFVTRIVERYRGNSAIIGWQVEHEPVDPLGMEHSWRLSAAFVRREVAAVRAADPSRPVILTGFLPTSIPVRLQQRWRTRDQGDSLAVAGQQADIVGLNIYPRHALVRLGPRTAYLAGSESPWQQRASARLCVKVARSGRRLMVTEGQAEPWETVTTPPSLPGRAMFSCLPEHVIGTYNRALQLGSGAAAGGLWAYLFWGAEYWLKRRDQGDETYLAAFDRVLTAGSGPGVT
ncbi:MAG: beta-galactosidase [Streptosporangiaceae bacterium]